MTRPPLPDESPLPAPTPPAAFAAALRQVERARRDGLATRDGTPAAERLDALHAALAAERDRVAGGGAVDAEWVRRTVREVAAWTPDTELGLLAALGGIARAR